jgi:hypothetical protein
MILTITTVAKDLASMDSPLKKGTVEKIFFCFLYNTLDY